MPPLRNSHHQVGHIFAHRPPFFKIEDMFFSMPSGVKKLHDVVAAVGPGSKIRGQDVASHNTCMHRWKNCTHNSCACTVRVFSGDVCGPLISMQLVFFPANVLKLAFFFHDVRETITHPGNGSQWKSISFWGIGNFWGQFVFGSLFFRLLWCNSKKCRPEDAPWDTSLQMRFEVPFISWNFFDGTSDGTFCPHETCHILMPSPSDPQMRGRSRRIFFDASVITRVQPRLHMHFSHFFCMDGWVELST